jgi:hypothetical protein
LSQIGNGFPDDKSILSQVQKAMKNRSAEGFSDQKNTAIRKGQTD